MELENNLMGTMRMTQLELPTVVSSERRKQTLGWNLAVKISLLEKLLMEIVQHNRTPFV